MNLHMQQFPIDFVRLIRSFWMLRQISTIFCAKISSKVKGFILVTHKKCFFNIQRMNLRSCRPINRKFLLVIFISVQTFDVTKMTTENGADIFNVPSIRFRPNEIEWKPPEIRPHRQYYSIKSKKICATPNKTFIHIKKLCKTVKINSLLLQMWQWLLNAKTLVPETKRRKCTEYYM